MYYYGHWKQIVTPLVLKISLIWMELEGKNQNTKNCPWKCILTEVFLSFVFRWSQRLKDSVSNHQMICSEVDFGVVKIIFAPVNSTCLTYQKILCNWNCVIKNDCVYVKMLNAWQFCLLVIHSKLFCINSLLNEP